MEKEKKIDVLLVEDNLSDTELTTYALTAGNDQLKLLHVCDGAEALRYVFSRRLEQDHAIQQDLKVILLDLKLPKIDGLEVLRKLRADEQTSMIPVVMFSSSNDIADVAEAYSLGVNSYVVKPHDFEKYVSIVNSISDYWSSVNQNFIP